MKQAMIFAAGLGTRLKPLTDTMPKALVRVGGQPLLWHVVQKLKAAGYERIVVNVHHFAQQIVDYLRENGNFGLDIRISDETEQLLETGGGIKKALPLFDPTEPILIHNVDILSNLSLPLTSLPPTPSDWRESAEAVEASPSRGRMEGAVALLIVSQRKTKRYLQFDDDMRLIGWKNIETGEVKGPITHHPTPITHHPSPITQLAFSGLHVLYPSAFPLLAEWPERFPIMDFYLKHCADHVIRGYEAPNLRLLDVGKLDTLEAAEQFLQEL